jgi:hypothetical protein
MKHFMAAGVIAAAGLVLAGCSSDESPSEASDRYCDTLTGLDNELVAFRELVATDASVDELDDQRDAVRDAAEEVSNAADDVDAAVAAQVSDARSDFEDVVGDIPGDASASEALAVYSDAVEEYYAAIQSTLDEVGCA